MLTLPPQSAPKRAVYVSYLLIQLLVAVCEGMVHTIFSGSSKGGQTAPKEIFKLTYIQFMFCLYAPCCVIKSFRNHVIIPPAYVWYIIFVFSVILFVCVCVYLLF